MVDKTRARVNDVNLDALHLVVNRKFQNNYGIVSESGNQLPASIYEVALWKKYVALEKKYKRALAALEKKK